MPLKVLMCSFEFPPFSEGGLSRYADELYHAVTARHGIDVSLVTAAPSGTPAPEGQDHEVIRLPRSLFTNRVLSYPAFSLKLWNRYIRGRIAQDFDVVHALSPQSYIIAPSPNTGFVVTDHNTFARQLTDRYQTSVIDAIPRRAFYHTMARLEARLCRSSDAVIAVSEGTGRDLKEYYGIEQRKVNVIPNGIRADVFKDEPPPSNGGDYGHRPDQNRTKLLFVGRLVPRKGLERLLKALPLITAKQSGTTLTVVGSGEAAYERKLRDMVSGLGLEGTVRFKSHVDDQELVRCYKEHDVFVFPSRVEGFGLVLLEAMACGLPVVASDIQGVNEVVRDGKGGILVDCDDIHELADATILLLTDDEAYAHHRASALQRVEEFSWERTASAVIDVYREVCRG